MRCRELLSVSGRILLGCGDHEGVDVMSSGETRLELRTRAVGPWQTNTYMLACPETGKSVLVDPAAEPEALLAMLCDSEPVGILITHAHPDHIGALADVREELGVPVLAHQSARGLKADRWLRDTDVVMVGNHRLWVRHTPGHTDDMSCYGIEHDNRVIVGDAIFEGGPGHTSSPEAFQTTLRTLREVILAWPDGTVCYPGHGSPFCLGDKRAAIEDFLSKDHGSFFGDATWEM
jgi:hydroxyacylglutathione hydrolase